MSLKKFPNYMYELVVITGEIDIGTYTIANDGEITNMYLTMMINGVSNISNESVYLKATRSSHTGTPIQSSSVNVSSFVSGSTSWLGKVRFDFNNETLNQNDTIQVSLGTQNYSRGTVEIGAILNYLDANGAFDVSINKAAYLTIFNNR
jgi:hypothetical protein